MNRTSIFLRLVLSAVAIMFSFALYAQSHQLSFGGGVNLLALRDQAYSPLRYSGFGFEGVMGYRAAKESKETIWLLSAGGANLNSKFDRNLNSFAIRLTNYNFYSRSDKDAPLRWGWANNNGFHHRLIGDFQNFNGRVDFFTTFGPAANYHFPFTLGEKRFIFHTAAHLQLVGIYLPSGYVASLPSGFGYESNSFVGSVIDSMKIFHPGSSFNGALWPRLEWLLDSGNGIALNYHYEYSHFTNPHRSARSSGHWFITFNMTLK